MKKFTPFIKHLTIFLGATTFAFASFSHASGSFGGGNAGNQNQAEYHKGKSVLKKNLKCNGCPLETMKINKETAPDIIGKIDAGSFNSLLNKSESSAVKVYLERRYKI